MRETRRYLTTSDKESFITQSLHICILLFFIRQHKKRMYGCRDWVITIWEKLGISLFPSFFTNGRPYIPFHFREMIFSACFSDFSFSQPGTEKEMHYAVHHTEEDEYDDAKIMKSRVSRFSCGELKVHKNFLGTYR